jgi:tRNA/tmRNA/rRNA uracil-C5-methylase (TrmA/RlmC/RlmD family)
VEVTCERLGTGGVGVCTWGASKLVLLVRSALPGERLTAAITAVKRNYAEGFKVASLAPHRDAATPACQHFGAGCGGCSLQALSYAAQLAHKEEHVAQVLMRVGKFDAQTVQHARQHAVPAPASAQYGYRNKIQLAFSSRVWQQQQQQQDGGQQQQQQQQGAAVSGWGLGYLVPGSSDVVLPIQQCSLVVSLWTALGQAAAWLVP